MIVHRVSAVFLKNIIERVCNEKESQMWCWFGKIFSDKQMSLDFVDLEDAKIQQQRQSAEENLYMFGNGLAQLVWGTSSLVRCFVNIIASVIMIVPLFISKSGNAFIDNPVWILILLASVTLGGFSNSKATIKENEVFMKWCEGTVWFNRAFMFFGKELYMSQERAKDVRIYQQNTIAEKVFDKLIQCDRENKTDIFKMSIYPALASVIIGLANIVCYLFVALKAFFGAFGVGSIVQYVAVLLTFGQGIQQLMYVQADNAVYCTYLQKLFDYLDLPNNMYKGSLTVEKRDDNEYMSIFSVVFQDFRLFSFSLAQNVATNMDYNADKVRSCLKKAGFKSHLSSLKNDIDVCLYKDFDTDGVEVSGGEAQKIALARALYKDAPFIILDEPTAALDPISEYEVYSKFNEIADNKTAIYISHRLASCRFCDVIAVFHEGAVIQNGTHEELLADSKGKYFELWNAQLQYYKRS